MVYDNATDPSSVSGRRCAQPRRAVSGGGLRARPLFYWPALWAIEARHVSGRRGGHFVNFADQVCDAHTGVAASLFERAAAAAAEIDAVAIENGGGAEVCGDDLADGHVERGSHVEPPPAEYEQAARPPMMGVMPIAATARSPRAVPLWITTTRKPSMMAAMPTAEELLKTTPIFSRLSPADRKTIADVADVQHFAKGETIFEQESPSDAFYAIASGRVKIFKMMPNGKDVILEVFGPGDPLGAVAAYMDRPFPASASALEDTTCVVIPRPGVLPAARNATHRSSAGSCSD